MIIEQIDSSKVLISLCKVDMEAYKLEFNNMDLKQPHSKKILERLLSIVCDKTGLSTKNKRLVMEALPLDNGCIILVTFMDIKPKKAKYRIKKHKTTVCFAFDNTENFIKAISLLYRQNIYFRSCKAILYNKMYYIVFEGCPVATTAKRILSEFGSRKSCTVGLLSALKEAGVFLCDSNAVDVIGKAFSGNR